MSVMGDFLYGRQHSVAQFRDLPWPTTVTAGRVLLSLIFVMSGVVKLLDWSGTAAYMEQNGLLAVPVLLTAAALVEIVGGLSILTGTFARLGALMLFLFLIPTTLIFHDFWTFEGAARQMQMANFLKNLAIMGGLFLLMGYGAGKVSVDTRLKPRFKS